MSDNERFGTLYEELAGTVGVDRLNELIRLERGFNQKHWAKKLLTAKNSANQYITPVECMEKVIEEMTSQANDYLAAPSSGVKKNG